MLVRGTGGSGSRLRCLQRTVLFHFFSTRTEVSGAAPDPYFLDTHVAGVWSVNLPQLSAGRHSLSDQLVARIG